MTEYTEAEREYVSRTTLMERDTAGLHVELAYLPIMGETVLRVRVGDSERAVTVEPSRAREAFDHPAIFVPNLNELLTAASA